MIAKYWIIHFITSLILFEEYSCQIAKPVKNANSFGTSLVEVMKRSEYGNKSWLISPSSIKTVLEQLYLGTGGNTRKQLGSELHLSKDANAADNEIAQEQANLKATTGEGVTLQSANRILIKDSFPLNAAFKSQISSIFHTDVQSTSFDSPEATADALNSWASNNTHGLITQLVSPGEVGPDSIMVLINALYFKGSWRFSFSPDESGERCFYAEPGKCKMTTMMSQQRMLPYGEHKKLGAKVISLPYKDVRYSMVIVLPDSYNGLSNVLKQLPKVQLLSFIQDLDSENVKLIMPKFTTRFKANMNAPLKLMGMQTIFQDTANFTAMSKEAGIYVSSIIHEAYISVSENGTIAAAATGAIMARNMDSSPPQYVVFNVDRPFLYYILLDNTQILFTGQYIGQ